MKKVRAEFQEYKPNDALEVRKEILIKNGKRLIGISHSSNTKSAYRSDWAQFEIWCSKHDYTSLPASEECIGSYISDLVLQEYKANTIKRKVNALQFAHQAAEKVLPITHSIQLMLAGTRKELGTKQQGKAPITINMLKQMVEATNTIDNSLKSCRDKALLLIGFLGAFRRSEIVSIDVEDIKIEPEGLVVNLRRSKTDQEGESALIGLPKSRDERTCPIIAFKNWIELSQIKSGPVFQSVNRHGHLTGKRLSDRAIANVVKEYVELCGYDSVNFSGHSLRAGFVTEAARAGANERSIANQSRHKSMKTLRRYIRMGNVFTENAANDLGL